MSRISRTPLQDDSFTRVGIRWEATCRDALAHVVKPNVVGVQWISKLEAVVTQFN
jgi:hypothetical protein